MKSWLLLYLLVLGGCSSAPPAPPVKAVSPQPGDSLPAGFAIREPDQLIHADFNGDGQADLAGSAEDLKGNTYFFIEFGGEKASLYLLSRELRSSTPKYDKKKNVLTLSYSSGASSTGESSEAKFRYQNGDFFLIGSSREEYMFAPGCDEADACPSDRLEINYLTGDVIEGEGKHKTHKKQKIEPLRSLKEFNFDQLALPQ